APTGRVLRDERQTQSPGQTALLTSGGQPPSGQERSDRGAATRCRPQQVPDATAQAALARPGQRRTDRPADQPVLARRGVSGSPVPQSLADRGVLPLDQAAPSDQGVLRAIAERGAGPGMDRGERLHADCDPEEAAWALGQPVRNPTDFEHHALRENPAGMRPAARKLPQWRGRARQPIESIRFLTGQYWLAQREVTKRKGTPVWRPAGILPYGSACGLRGFSTA